jgi:Cu-processing system ATP-binding protein
LIGRFGLALDLDRPTETLSGGTRQKLSAVLAFLFRPRILLLDEPTAGLDPVARVVLKDRISELRDGGAAILLSSHVLAELEDLADDVLLLVDGVVRFDGSVGELVRRTRTTRLERAVAAMAEEPGP